MAPEKNDEVWAQIDHQPILMEEYLSVALML